MKYLLDTCALSELTKPKPAPSVLAWLEAADPDSLALSVLTLGELEQGVEALRPGKRKRELRGWLDGLRESYADRVLEVTADIAVAWGRANAAISAKGRTVPAIDGLIASTAMAHSLIVVTRNTKHMATMGARALDVW